MNTQTISSSTPHVAVINGKIKTTSLKIAEHFGKRHTNVLRAIKDLDCSAEFNQLNFEPVKYTDEKGEQQPFYEITRDGFTFLAMGFTGAKAAQWKEAYIAAFNALEASVHAQQTPQQPSVTLEDIERLIDSKLKAQPASLPPSYASGHRTLPVNVGFKEDDLVYILEQNGYRVQKISM